MHEHTWSACLEHKPLFTRQIQFLLDVLAVVSEQLIAFGEIEVLVKDRAVEVEFKATYMNAWVLLRRAKVCP